MVPDTFIPGIALFALLPAFFNFCLRAREDNNCLLRRLPCRNPRYSGLNRHLPAFVTFVQNRAFSTFVTFRNQAYPQQARASQEEDY